MTFWNWLKEHGPVIAVVIAGTAFLDSRIDARFEAVDARFDAVDVRFDEMDKRLTGRIDAVDGRIDGLERRIASLEQRLAEELRAIRQDIGDHRNALDQRIDRLMLAVSRAGISPDGMDKAAIALLTGAEVQIPLSAVLAAAAGDAVLQDRLVPARYADRRLVLYPGSGDGRLAALLDAEGWRPVEAGNPGRGFVRAPVP